MKLQNKIQSMSLIHFEVNKMTTIRKRNTNGNDSMLASMPSNGLSVMVCDYIVLFFLLISSNQ